MIPVHLHPDKCIRSKACIHPTRLIIPQRAVCLTLHFLFPCVFLAPAKKEKKSSKKTHVARTVPQQTTSGKLALAGYNSSTTCYASADAAQGS